MAGFLPSSDVEAVLRWYDGMSSQNARMAMEGFTENCRYWAVQLTDHGLERYWLNGRDTITEYLDVPCTLTFPGKLSYVPIHVASVDGTVLVECTTDGMYKVPGSDTEGHHYLNRGVYVFDCNPEHRIVEMRPFYDWGPVAGHRRATGWSGAEMA